MSESIEEVIWPALGLIFLLLGIVLIASILFSSFNPYDQIAFANAEKLRASINQVCAGSTGNELNLQSLELRQNTPTMSWFFTILPRWMIRSNGDPNYVLYHESFPPYEAVGWEVYQPFGYRLISPVDDAYLQSKQYASNAVAEYAQNVHDTYKKLPGHESDIVDAVLINNIVLSQDFRSDVVYRSGVRQTTDQGSGFTTQTAVKNFFGYGYWKYTEGTTTNPDLERDNIFKFKNYLGLSDIEKSLVKYQPCGPNSLCLKTRDGIYSFPLTDQCSDIKNVQLVYNAVGDDSTIGHIEAYFGLKATSGVTSWLSQKLSQGILKNLFSKLITGLNFAGKLSYVGQIVTVGDLMQESVSRHMAFKISDFYMVSPCSLQSNGDVGIKVVKTRCDTTEPKIPGYTDTTYTTCTNVMKYPLYKYNSNPSSQKLEKLKDDHYVCVESVSDKDDGIGVSDPPTTQYDSNDYCIQVIVTSFRDGYCWTPNPYKKSDGFWETLLTTDPVIEASKIFISPPIRKNSAFVENPAAVVLGPTQSALAIGTQLYDALDRKWWWGWP